MAAQKYKYKISKGLSHFLTIDIKTRSVLR